MKMKRIIAVLLVLLMVTAMVPVASAAGTVAPGEKVSDSIKTKEACYGANGYITVTGPAKLTAMGPSANVELTGEKSGAAFFYGANEIQQEVTFTLQADSNAKDGDVITVTFDYEWSDAQGNMTASSNTWEVTVDVDADEPT